MKKAEKSLVVGVMTLLVATSLAAGVWAQIPVQSREDGLSAGFFQGRQGRRGRLGKPGRRGDAPGRVQRQERRVTRDSMIVRALRAANLTPDQQRRVGEIRDRNDTRIRGLGRRLIDQRRSLVDALEEPVPNVSKARAILGDLTTTIGEQVVARTDVELELFQMLTPQQRASVRAFRDARIDERARDGRGTRVDRGGRRAGDSFEEDDPSPDDSNAAGDRRTPALSTSPAPSQQTPSDGESDEASQGLRPLRALDLDSEQRRKLRELRRQHGPNIRSITARFREARKSLGDALLADTVDAELVKKLGIEVGRFEADRAKLRFEVEVGLLSILTPDQVRRYRELRRERRRGAAPASARGLDRP